MERTNNFIRPSSLFIVFLCILAFTACTPDQTASNAVRQTSENGVKTYEWQGETLAMEFPQAATEQARQFVTDLFNQRFDYTKIYEADTDLEKVLTAGFGKLTGKNASRVNNQFEKGQVDQMVTYHFSGIDITYYITSQGKKIFESLTVTGETRLPLAHGIKIGMDMNALTALLGEPIAQQKESLYYGHLVDAGLYYEAQVFGQDTRLNRIELRIAGGV